MKIHFQANLIKDFSQLSGFSHPFRRRAGMNKGNHIKGKRRLIWAGVSGFSEMNDRTN